MNPLDQVLTTQAAVNAAAPDLNKLKQSCTALEANFLKSLVQQMRKGTEAVHFGDAPGGDIYQGMFDDQLSNILAQKQTLGISRSIYGPMAAQVIGQQLQRQAAAAKQKTENTTR